MTSDRHHKNKTWGNSNSQAVAVPPKVFLPLQLSIRCIREIRGKAVAVSVAVSDPIPEIRGNLLPLFR
jgi:hypothetical protein